ERLAIASFSQGGGPDSHGPFAPIPITAGSSDGDVMLFFYGEVNGDTGGISQVKVITTIDNGAQGAPPEDQARPWSYPFTLASNARLPTEFCPTLIVQFATPEERDLLTGDLLICRLVEREGDPRWVAQPTYLPAGATFAATPLAKLDEAAAEQPGGSLIAREQPETGRVERYQLWWVPRQPGAGAVPARDEEAQQDG
ncbi:MAG TPA: hypothetical protein VF310_12015, partial [Vicinamibacteria bacterium]